VLMAGVKVVRLVGRTEEELVVFWEIGDILSICIFSLLDIKGNLVFVE